MSNPPEFDCGVIQESVDNETVHVQVFARPDAEFPNQLGEIELIDPQTGEQVYLGPPDTIRAQYPSAIAVARDRIVNG